MNKKSLVIFSSLFVIALFFMSACENEAVGSRLKQNVAEGGGGSPLVMKGGSEGNSSNSTLPEMQAIGSGGGGSNNSSNRTG